MHPDYTVSAHDHWY